jgi:hypothetical protein
MVLIDGKVNFYNLNIISGSLQGTTLGLNDCIIASKETLSKYQTLSTQAIVVNLMNYVAGTQATCFQAGSLTVGP